jgi:sucrose-phosphate synthase
MNPPTARSIHDGSAPTVAAPQSTAHIPRLFITDIDGTLLHEGRRLDQPGLDILTKQIRNRAPGFLWGVATGRRLAHIQEAFLMHRLPTPDVVIASVGTEIHLALDGSSPDADWAAHLAHGWDANAVRSAVRHVPGLMPQSALGQGRFKVSFHILAAPFDSTRLDAALGPWSARVRVIITRGTHLDIVPRRASKGRAIAWFSGRAGVAPGEVIVAGDSGNDLDMLAGAARAIVVGNHSDELLPLRGKPSVYFSSQPATLGILDGLRHFEVALGAGAGSAPWPARE